MGNLVVESALDANITFRMRGRGQLFVNDINVMTHLGGNVSQFIASSEMQLVRSEISEIRNSLNINRGLATRVRILENS